MKVKEQQQAYQKAREANSQSSAKLQTWHFHKKMHAILGGDPTTTSHSEEKVEEEEARMGDVTKGSNCGVSRDLFETPPQSSQLSMCKPDAEEGISAAAVEAVRGSPSIPVECLSQIRKRNKRFRMTCSARSCKPVLYQTLNRGPGELILHCMEKGPDAREGDAPGYNGISLAANTDAVESCGPMGSIILDSPPFGELQYMENSTIAHSTPQ
ncbi:uncharacterized protein LOC120405975 isoform X1 [Mauremys reevesii]|uniref:uncharacterized protein LOC120405975 isoform X1 n=1 Tax=Mauremys reevesii TaxID=260615 RepID=UPI00193F14F2|nr:uncharacterized protein LOC120405975 isoform X1 [Mauremys reevesii]